MLWLILYGAAFMAQACFFFFTVYNYKKKEVGGSDLGSSLF